MIEWLREKINLNNTVTIVAGVLALSWAWSTIGVLQRNYDLQTQVEQAMLQNQITELGNENLRLQQSYFRTDEFLELQTRALLNKGRAGEHLVLLPMNDNETVGNQIPASGTPVGSTPLPAEEASNSEQWLDFLFAGNRGE